MLISTFFIIINKKTSKWIASSFFDTLNIQQIANRANVSSHTVYQVLSTIHHSSNLGEAISIDEFKGNVGTEKYQTIVVDPVKHRVFDVLYSRKGTCLVDYFKSLDQSKHMKVQYFSCDMNKTFIDLARIYFPNAKIVIDRYHFVRQVYWALENVRKGIQKRMLPSLRKYYKRSKSLITKRKAKLSNDNRAALE